LGVAGVRCLVAEDRRRELALAENLVHQTQLDLPEPASAEFGGKVCGPQPLSLHRFLQWSDCASVRLVVDVEGLQRNDLLTYELAHPRELLLELRLSGKAPGHPISSVSSV